MYKKFILIALITCLNSIVNAQEALHNMGNLKIHENGALGFHYDLINNGSFDENLGLAGFFNSSNLLISGALRPIFNDLEIMVEENIALDIGIGINGHLNFVDGDIVSSRSFTDINTDFIYDGFYSGENDTKKIDGYAMMTQKHKFIFPIGDSERFRPLLLETIGDTINAKSAYFLENPNTPATFDGKFDTSEIGENLNAVSTIEYWHLEADTNGRVELLWDDRSNIKTIVNDVDNLTVVGWHSEKQEWQNLGAAALKGDLDSGRILSEYFDTSGYPIITVGSSTLKTSPELNNYLLTLNNDGVNEFLVIDGTDESPNNTLSIFNRWGRSVYVKENYSNQFDGRTNTGLVLRRGKILPPEVYFYVIELKDLDIIHQGYLYINE